MRATRLGGRGAAIVFSTLIIFLGAGMARAQDDFSVPEPSAAAVKDPDARLPHDPYSVAVSALQKGEYEAALPMLQRFAEQGRGSEVAQVELGRCYYGLAQKATSPETAQHDRTLGLAWVLDAAESNFGEAQQLLVRLYLDGDGISLDPVEAGKWYLIWKRNPIRYQVGGQFDPGLERRLGLALTQADWAEAKQRAKEWQPS